VRALLLPAVEHQLMDGFRAIHWRGKTVVLLDGLDHILVGPSPVGSLAVGHDLPHDDAETPDVGRRCELPERDRFGGCPPDRNFSAAGRVGAVDVGVRDLPGEAEVGDFAHQLRIYLKIGPGQISIKSYLGLSQSREYATSSYVARVNMRSPW